jgi:transcriptional regulator with XRE-family HTH domain
MQCPKCGGKGTIVTGHEMRKLRTECEYTMSYIASRMGISQAYLSDLERDRREWNHSLYLRFLHAIVVEEDS